MSFFSRLEVVSYLNIDKVPSSSRQWEPHWRSVQIDFQGIGTAIKILNGEGKTTLSRAILGLLTRQTSFTDPAHAVCAAKHFGFWSHVRLELIEARRHHPQTELLPVELDGTRYVLGFYGYADDRLNYYAYRGSLDDVPVVRVDGDVHRPIANDEFDRLRKAYPMELDPSATVREWREYVHFHLDAAMLQQMAEYQRQGAGDGTGTLFKMEVPPGRAYDTEFFYRYLAPEVLVGCMSDEGEDDEYRFEDTLFKSASILLLAQRNHDIKQSKLEGARQVAKKLSQASELAEDYQRVRTQRMDLIGRSRSEFEALRSAVIDGLVPGIPRPVSTGNDQTRWVANCLVIDEGRWWAPDDLLAEIFDDTVSATNQRAGRKGWPGKVLSSQVIENPCDSFLQKGRRGPSGRGYSEADAKELLGQTTRFSKDWNAGSASRALTYAFQQREGAAESNPLRTAERNTILQADAARARAIAAKLSRDTLEQDIRDLQVQLQSAEANEIALRRMEASKLFSVTELTKPGATRDQVAAALKDAEQAAKDLEERNRLLEHGRQEYSNVSQHFGVDVGPAACWESLRTRASAWEQTYQTDSQALGAAREALRQAQSNATATAEAFDKGEADYQKLLQVAPGEANYREWFSDRDPSAIEDAVRGEHQRADEAQRAAEKKLRESSDREGRMAGLAQTSSEFEAVFGPRSATGLEDELRRRQQSEAQLERGLERTLVTLDQHLNEFLGWQTGWEAAHTRFGSGPLTEKEDTLRAEQLAALEKRADAASQCEHLEALGQAWEQFEVLFGTQLLPMARRAERMTKREQLSESLRETRTQQADLESELTELQTAGRSAGRTARTAEAAIERALGMRPVRVHELIAQACPEGKLPEQRYIEFSQVLHAPVLRDRAQAEQALQALSDEGLDYPVFRHDALTAYCSRSEDDPDRPSFNQGVFWGHRSLAVELLLDRQSVARRIALLQSQIEGLQKKCLGLQEELAELADDSESSQALRLACDAQQGDARRLLSDVRTALAHLDRGITQRNSWLTSPILEQIRAASAYELAGGASKHADVEHQYDAVAIELKEKQEQLAIVRELLTHMPILRARERLEAEGGLSALEALRKEIPSLQEAYDEAKISAKKTLQRVENLHWASVARAFRELGGATRYENIQHEREQLSEARDHAAHALASCNEQHEGAQQTERESFKRWHAELAVFATWKQPLAAAAKFVADGGPMFDAELPKKSRSRAMAVELQQKRSRFDFDLAEQGARARNDPAASDAARRRMDNALRERDLAEQTREEAERQAQQFDIDALKQRNAARDLDRAAWQLISAWRDARALQDDLDPAEISSASKVAATSHVKAFRDGLAALARIHDDWDQLVRQVEAIAATVERFEYKAAARSIKTLQSDEQRALKQVREQANALANDDGLELSEAERAQLRGEGQANTTAVVNAIAQLQILFLDYVAKGEERLAMVKADLLGARNTFNQSMNGFTHNLRRNFDIMKRTLKATGEGGAGLIVEASVLDQADIEKVTGELVDEIEEFLVNQENNKKKQSNVRLRDSTAEFKQDLGQAFYRRVFTGAPGQSAPTVRLQFPAISREARRLEKGLSTGQLNAIFLMVILKLSEFADRRERDLGRNSSFSSAQRRRARSSRVLIIDGMFSNLSKPSLIKQAKELVKSLRGDFQLIGLIHNPAYENDPTLFGNYMTIRRFGREHGFMARTHVRQDGSIVPLTMKMKPLPPPEPEEEE